MKRTVLPILLLLLAGCGGKSSRFDDKNNEAIHLVTDNSQPPSASHETAVSGLTTAGSKDEKSLSANLQAQVPAKDVHTMAAMIKKTADIDITVDDYAAARAAVERIVKSSQAYISGENEQNSTYRISNHLVIRVSNQSFESLIAGLSGIASHVNSKNSYSEDVTADYVDISARLKSKKEVEQRYIELLAHAQKVSDILEIEEQLRVIREEIEAKEAQLNYLKDQVTYSTVNLDLHQDFEYIPSDEPGFFGRIGHAFGNGWKGFLSLLIGLVYVWPLWLILGIVSYVLLRFLRKRIKK